jgi:sec-independent protein translocase protein TatA
MRQKPVSVAIPRLLFPPGAIDWLQGSGPEMMAATPRAPLPRVFGVGAMGLSFSHLVLLLLVVLVVFGAGRIPQVMGDIAKGVKNFRAGLKDDAGESGEKTEKT